MYAIRSYYVGFNRVKLERKGEGRFIGGGMLPVCVRDAMEWEAKVLVHARQGISSVAYRVITSYSIHYTKLYDGRRRELRGDGDRRHHLHRLDRHRPPIDGRGGEREEAEADQHAGGIHAVA